MKASQTWLYVAALVVFAAAAAGCGQQPAQTEGPQLVRTVTVGAEAEREAGAYSGTVRGRYESALAFQAGGRITARNVQLGSVVHAGDVLMTVDPKDVVQSVYQAQAQVNAAQAQLQLAEANLARYKQLFSQDAVSAAAPQTKRQQTAGRLRIVSVLMGWGMEDGIERSDAMRARGYDCGARRTTYKRYRFGRADASVLAAIVVLAAVAGACAAAVCLRFSFYPTLSGWGAWCAYLPYALLMAVPSALRFKEWLLWR